MYVISAEIDGDNCVLFIRRVNALRDAGPWLCEVGEYRGDTIERYVFLRVDGGGSSGVRIGGPSPFRVDSSLRRTTARKSYSKTLRCPVRSVAGSLTVCNWKDPLDRDFAFVGRGARRVADDNISFGGTKTECAIHIDRVESKHFGTWSCKVLGLRTDDLPGSVSETSSVELIEEDGFRNNRFSKEDTLQGYKRGDEKVEITMDVTVDSSTERGVQFYWIVQRNYVVREDDDLCPREKRECYDAQPRYEVGHGGSSRGRLTTNGKGIRDYELTLEFDAITYEDLESPVVLVKEYRTSSKNRRNSRERRFDMFFVDSYPRGGQSLDPDRDDGCIINRRFHRVDEDFVDDRLCVVVTCEDVGEVYVEELKDC